ncbi:hypothetical protein BJ165DRAFT_318000 [Panaeolus papilionaceus]|nr:hypothetical protein BJ165DRAFT_318000 [Panaeolus papilionaceus]
MIVQCTLYIARLLSYTRSTVIPCFLSITGEDSRVLDTFYARHPHKYDSLESLERGGGSRYKLSFDSEHLMTKFTSSTNEISRAIWWKPPKDIEQHPLCRYLAGEIHLSPALLPSSPCEFFRSERRMCV